VSSEPGAPFKYAYLDEELAATPPIWFHVWKVAVSVVVAVSPTSPVRTLNRITPLTSTLRKTHSLEEKYSENGADLVAAFL
jgi:hypothetical protein